MPNPPSTERAETSMADKERGAFEAWANDQGFLLHRLDTFDGASYQDLRTQGPWDAWQARASFSSSGEMGERERQELRRAAFAKVGAELFLERVSSDQALVRLHIGHLSFGIGQPRNGTEAASVLRTFRDALTDLLEAASEFRSSPIKQEMPEALSDAEIDELLHDLNGIAREYDRHEYGLPMHQNPERINMRAAVRAAIERAVIAQKGKGEN